jgi:hypothetical protein
VGRGVEGSIVTGSSSSGGAKVDRAPAEVIASER